MKCRLGPWVLLGMLAGHLMAAELPAHAQYWSLVVGKSSVHTLPQAFKRLAIGNPDVADVIALDGRDVYLLAKKPGSTNLSVWSMAGALQVIDLQIEPDTSVLQERFRRWWPDETDLHVETVGNALVLRGELRDPLRLAQALSLAEHAAGGGKVVNLLSTATPRQVLLQVKVAEVSRSLSDKLGVSVNTNTDGLRSMRLLTDFLSGGAGSLRFTGGGATISLDAEVSKGLIKILAQPSILALSGHEGSFLAGGKVFIPVPQASAGTGTAQMSLHEREYGVGLKFLPSVLPGGQIQLKVTPEVSELSATGTAVKADGVVSSVLPTITTRRTSTTVQLQDGESFAIGGLIKNNLSTAVSQFPFLSDLPILGPLFRSTDFQNDLTELVFVVTVRLVAPLQQMPAIPTDGFEPASRTERVWHGNLEHLSPSVAPNASQLR